MLLRPYYAIAQAFIHKSVAPDCTFMHCTIHHENLASMTFAPELMKMQRHVIMLINTVKSSALKTCLFRRFYEQIYTDHCNFLYHTEGRWQSMGNVLKRIFALRIELRDFYTAIQGKADKRLQQHVVLLAYQVTFLAD